MNDLHALVLQNTKEIAVLKEMRTEDRERHHSALNGIQMRMELLQDQSEKDHQMFIDYIKNFNDFKIDIHKSINSFLDQVSNNMKKTMSKNWIDTASKICFIIFVIIMFFSTISPFFK